MKLALVTGWLACTAVAVWAAPAPAHLKAPADDTFMALDARRTDGACIRLSRSTTPCLVARQDANPMQPSTPSETPASSTAGSLSSSKTTFNSPTDLSQSTHSFTMTLSSAAHGTEAEANADSNYSPANNQLRTIGIIGGLLAGIALIAIICIILILLRNYRRRGSIAPSSIRSRTASSTRQHRPQFLTRQVGDPIMRPPALRINTGDVMATVSRDLTTTGTLGHHGGLHPFPVSGHDSASSRTTSFGHHSASTGPSSLPRRPPQIPSLGLSQPRPLLRSFGSLFSHNASAGHLSVIAREEHPQPSVPPPPSTTGSKTMAATEDADRTEQTDRTEDTGRTETTHTTHTEETGTMPVEQSHESSPKPA